MIKKQKYLLTKDNNYYKIQTKQIGPKIEI